MKCSVIVPVYNDWHRVPELLACLERQSFDREQFEIILVDNASERFTPPDPMPPNARIETCATPGSYAARNQGIAHARGQWLAFTDADCRPRPDWLQNLLVAASARNDKTIVAGPVEMVPQNDPPNRWEIYDLVRGIPQAWYVRRGYAATANLAMSAALMSRLGGFDAKRRSGGDAELCRRAGRQGATLQYAPDAVVVHPARTRRSELLAKVRRVKAGQVAGGDWLRRVRTFLPPVIESWKCLRATRWSVGYRLIAISVQLSLWPAEIGQALHSNPREH